MRFLLTVIALSLTLNTLCGAEVLRLWPGDAPKAKGKRDCDIPTLTCYMPEKPSQRPRPAIVVCPGGAYSFVATDLEGVSYAKMLNEHGIAVFVLKYRLGSQNKGAYRYPVPQMDAQRAIRFVRANAKKYNIDPNKVGIMGSSAGGHLAAMTAVKNDEGNSDSTDPVEKFSSRPDFAVLCYAQTSMDKRYGACAGSRKMLLGSDNSPQIDEVAAYRFVNDNTPPCFIWHTFEDCAVPVRNALDFANALEANMVPFSLHIYHSGAHGMGTGGKVRHPWCGELIYWLKDISVI